MIETVFSLLKEELELYINVYGMDNLKEHTNNLLKMSNIPVSLFKTNPENTELDDKKSIVFSNKDEKLIINSDVYSMPDGANCQLNFEYKNDFRMIKAAFGMINDSFNGYSIADLEHDNEEDYMFYIREEENLYLDSVPGRPLVGTIYHFPKRIERLDSFSLFETTDKKDFILSNKYDFESISKLFNYFQEDPMLVLDTVKEKNIGKEIQFLSFSPLYDFIYTDGVCYLNLSKVPYLDEALSGEGKVYEFTKEDEEYFKKLGIFDMKEFTTWRNNKEKQLIKK